MENSARLSFWLVSSKVFSTIQVLIIYTILKLVEFRDKLFFTYIEIKSLFLVSSDKWLYKLGKNKILRDSLHVGYTV